MEKIILYYKFTPLPDPETVMHWQRELCTRLGLKGRVIISEHGINGTLGGRFENVKAYRRAMNLHPLFKGIEYKWSDGKAEDFPRLSIKVRPELVTLEPGEPFDVFNTGTPLRPKQWQAYLDEHPDAVVLDARNRYESDIGRFKNAITPDIDNFRDIKTELEKLPKDKPVLTYCTGDIRCEYLSAFMKHTGFDEVYHLDGGIVKYGEEFADDADWEGKCFVFDNRMSIAFSDRSVDIGDCVHCRSKTSAYINCANKACNKLILVCGTCEQRGTCSQACQMEVSAAA